MEDIVKGPMRGELEALNNRRDLLEHLEGAVSSWRQFCRWVAQPQVHSFEPNLVPLFETMVMLFPFLSFGSFH